MQRETIVFGRHFISVALFAVAVSSLSVYSQSTTPTEPESTTNENEPAGEVAGGSGVGTSSLLVTSTDCSTPAPDCTVIDAVLRYNGATGAYIGVHIPSIEDPSAMAIHPIRESLLVVSRADGKVREYDANNGAFVRVLVTPGAEGLNLPQGIALSPAGKLYLGSNQAEGQLTKFNGVLEFDSNTGAFVGEFIDGGSSVAETCSNSICLRGPHDMMVAPDGRLFVISAINDSVQEYSSNGTYLGSFISAKLIGPGGFVRRTSGPNTGNLLVSSRFTDPENPFDDTIIEFNGVTRVLATHNPQGVAIGGVFVNGIIRPGPLAWHLDGSLLVGERTDDIPPSYPFPADRVGRRNVATGVNMGQFTPAGDLHTHHLTDILNTHVNFATDDADSDSDTDLKDLASFQNCFPFSTTSQCLTPFDDNRTGGIGRWDFLAFIGNFHGPRQPCTNVGQCNDNDVCSVEQCTGGFCTYVSAAEGTSCADALFCDGPETCRSGVCRGKSPCIDEAHCNEATDVCRQCLVSSECNDNNPCTTDSCTASFTCQFAANTVNCNDGNQCTTNDKCAAGACVGGPPPNCNDNNVCSTDSCDTVLGCIHTDNLLPCDDGNSCSLQDFCLQGTCRRGRDRTCNDNNQCTDDSCNVNTGCVFQNHLGACDDGDPCSVSDSCFAGVCDGAPMNCSDTVACTVDRCVNGTCENVPDNSRCSNGNWCDGTETCHLTQGCLSAPPPCNDQIPCTVDNCDPDLQSCSHTPNNAACSNGVHCDGVEICSLTVGCRPGAPPNCNDNVACTVDACDEQADNCRHDPNAASCEDNNICTDNVCSGAGCTFPFNTATCNDGLACTINDRCANGTCAGSPQTCPAGQQCDPADGQCKACLNNTHCNDSNVCTTDTCNSGTCVFTPNSLSCDDGLFCTSTSGCVNAVCVGSGATCPQQCNETTDACVECLNPTHCNDNNSCTNNLCVSGACQYTPINGGGCNDGRFCTQNESCVNGVCTNGTIRTCNNVVGDCINDFCDLNADVCVSQTIPNGQACDDGDACTDSDTCQGGSCQSGTPTNCDPPPQCQSSIGCDAQTGECEYSPVQDGTACDDGNPCTLNDSCEGGACESGTPTVCGAPPPCRQAGVCNQQTGNCTYAPVQNATACDDGNACTLADTCQNGSCIPGTPVVCDPPVECRQSGVCNPSTGSCTYAPAPDGTSCNDGLFCTVEDECFGAVCDGLENDCDDGVDCTLDSCNETTNSCVHAPDNDACDDGQYCNGVETCSISGPLPTGCVDGLDVQCNDGVGCTIDSCNEAIDDCDFTPDDDACDNGDFCDGEEFCDPVLDCEVGPDPCPLDPHCNEVTDECVECLNDDHCDDFLFCTGVESCVNGACETTGDPCPGTCDEVNDECP